MNEIMSNVSDYCSFSSFGIPDQIPQRKPPTSSHPAMRMQWPGRSLTSWQMTGCGVRWGRWRQRTRRGGLGWRGWRGSIVSFIGRYWIKSKSVIIYGVRKHPSVEKAILTSLCLMKEESGAKNRSIAISYRRLFQMRLTSKLIYGRPLSN